MPPLTLQARVVFPVVGESIPNGAVTIADGRIAAVGRECFGGDVRRLGNAAILPGLVNAHVHLEFSELDSPLGRHGIDFTDWIHLTMQSRRSDAGWRPIAAGLAESARCGVTTLGEIAQTAWTADRLCDAPLGGVAFRELIAPIPSRVADALETARVHICSESNSWRPGLSPHAPYTVHPELLAAVVSISAAQCLPVAMHLAESEAELELLLTGRGPLRELLEERNAWDASLIRFGGRPLDYLKQLADCHRSIIVHGNLLDDEEIDFLGRRADRMSAVYCPRTHAWFDRGPYPLEKMFSAGVNVALGTDGRGSSPDLSILAEMHFTARRHPTVPLERILRMATLCGAQALGCENQTGSIEPGKQADLTVVSLPEGDVEDPHELLFDPGTQVVESYYRGRRIA